MPKSLLAWGFVRRSKPVEGIGWYIPRQGIEHLDRRPGRLFRLAVPAEVGLQVAEGPEADAPLRTNASDQGILAREGAERVGGTAVECQGLERAAFHPLDLTEHVFQSGQPEPHLHVARVLAQPGLTEGDLLL